MNISIDWFKKYRNAYDQSFSPKELILELDLMTTKNLSKPFKGKINGQRLPPIPIANEPPSVPTTNGNLPHSILKKSKPLLEEKSIDNHQLPLDDDELDTARTIFQKSQTDVLLLLDTYPPRTWMVPKCLKANHDNTFAQSQTTNPMFDTFFSANNQPSDLIDAFPAPLSDRLPSSRYCRRSISSSCSRRSSILFQRQTGIPVDSSQLRREETFDTVCESLNETLRSSYAPLPPIATDSPSNVTKSLDISTNDLPSTISVDPPVDLSKSLAVPSTNFIPSVSPPLIASGENPDIQEKREEFTRHLLSKSHRREPSSNLSRENNMHSPTMTHKTVTIKPVIVPRTQKSIPENHRVQSVDRQPVTTVNRSKLATAASSVSINTTTHQRLGKVSMDIFQPQPKSTTNNQTTNKKPTGINSHNKTKSVVKTAAPKLKVTPAPPPEEETNQSKNDVIPPSLPSPSSPSNETSQVTTTDKSEQLLSSVIKLEPVPLQMEPTKLDIPLDPKHPPAFRASSSRYSQRPSHPVPQPLTLQGEKTVDADYPQPTATRTSASAIACRQRRGSLKGQPLIMELFEDATMDTQKSIAKPEPPPPMKSMAMKPKKPRSNFVKNTKVKKPIAPIKPKTPAVVAVPKVEVRCQSTNTEMCEDFKPEGNMIVVGGTDWVMNVKPQVIHNDEEVLSQLFNQSTADDEDLPSCASPSIDQLAVSQSTLMTSMGELQRRDSIESEQAIEISPVLTQMIDHHNEPIPESPQQPPKPSDSSLLNSDIRAVYETVRDSMRKDASLRSLPPPAHDQDLTPTKLSLPSSTTSTSTQNKTLPFETSGSATHTYNNSDTGLSHRPALRVVNDSLNSRGSETIDSTSSHEDYGATPLCSESDCDEVYRTARKGRQVGRGAYGIVWSYLTITGRVIAVKEIELDEGDSERVRDDYESVREEIHILRALDHQYVVKFLGISLESARLVKIFMEYLPNGTIENLLSSFGPFHNDVLRKYTRQIVEGVAYLHDNNVVHRDIKGKNIMLDYDGNIKLIDFGCAKRLKKNQNTHSMRHLLKSMKGTANWMAPEVIAETGHGKKADIWSIGCTLCEMATGKPPWSSEHNHLAVLLIIVNGTKPPADLPDTCPVTAQEFFHSCLTRDPLQRPSARVLLSHPFLTH